MLLVLLVFSCRRFNFWLLYVLAYVFVGWVCCYAIVLLIVLVVYVCWIFSLGLFSLVWYVMVVLWLLCLGVGWRYFPLDLVVV